MSQHGDPPEGGQEPQQPDWGQQQPPQYGQPGGQPPQYGQPGGQPRSTASPRTASRAVSRRSTASRRTASRSTAQPYGNPGSTARPPQYGQPQYGGQPYGNQPAYGQGQPGGMQYGQPGGGYATWGQRALAMLWDVVVVLWPLALMFVGAILLGIGGALASGDSEGVGTALIIVGVIVMVVAYVWAIWRQIKNIIIDQGRTGYTYGKRKVGIRVIREQDGQMMGIGSAVARWLLHSILNSCLFLDYLWPLWDPKNQTLTDKILGTIVINQPAPQQY